MIVSTTSPPVVFKGACPFGASSMRAVKTRSRESRGSRGRRPAIRARASPCEEAKKVRAGYCERINHSRH